MEKVPGGMYPACRDYTRLRNDPISCKASYRLLIFFDHLRRTDQIFETIPRKIQIESNVLGQ
jgi:hypothetical protein